MPNTTPFLRQKAILAILKRNTYASFKKIEAFVNQRLEQQYLVDDKAKPGFSKRTFERDIKDIQNVYGTVILYSKKERGYFIETAIGDKALDQMLSAFEVLNAFKLSKNIAPFVFLENRKPEGTEHLFGLLHAIQNKAIVEFKHQKFWEEHQTNRTVKPLAIKEYRHRWYVVAQDEKDDAIKTFGLDRISELTITKRTFEMKVEFDVAQKYKDCYGVIGSHNAKPSDVILSFTPFQGKFIKSLPLHHSQKTLIDSEIECRISIHIYPTHDFIMELLSFGSEVKVIEPDWLALKVVEEHRLALERY